MEKVTGYTTTLLFGDRPRQVIQLLKDHREVGSIVLADPALFQATIDMLRNEGPNILWDVEHKTLIIGHEPTGEGEIASPRALSSPPQ